jgi:hypothetical protein
MDPIRITNRGGRRFQADNGKHTILIDVVVNLPVPMSEKERKLF